tara:strand:- start:1674 stop:2294 length:621 start_codon:yes stop_codon:yes gene_type:complete
MRPIPSPASGEAYELLKRAKSLLEKAEKLDMVEHEGKKVPAFAADGKGTKDEKKKADMGEKDKYCMKNFGKKYSECTAKEKAQCDKAHDKVEKGKGMGMCATCGEKKMDMEKGMCMKMGCTGKAAVDMKKGSQHKIQTFNTNPESTQFMIETGGNTYHQQYSTNNSLLDSEDVANKGASSSTVNLESLNRNQNPHDTPAPGHLTEG